MAGTDKCVVILGPHVNRATLMSADAGIGDDAIGRSRPRFFGQLGWIETRQNYQIESRFVAYRAVLTHRVCLHLRAPKHEIVDLDDLSLLGTGQEHEAII